MDTITSSYRMAPPSCPDPSRKGENIESSLQPGKTPRGAADTGAYTKHNAAGRASFLLGLKLYRLIGAVYGSEPATTRLED